MLENKIAIVTGASRGIGESIAIRFAKEGANVVVASRNYAKCEEVVKKIIKQGGTAVSFAVDITDFEQTKAMVDFIIERYGRVDILVNNAGIKDDNFFEKMSCEQWMNVISTNLNGTFFCTKAVVNYMIEQQYGRIINIASIAGQKGARTQANYAASKAGIIGMTVTLSQELGLKGITVNAVSPGLVSTDMVENIPQKIKERNLKKIPLGRFGKPEEIASVVMMLASDDGAYCNGMICEVNGGICI
ncbi:MAG: beta-ketoacyl-ACP reductase [Lachnospiraceae bacterium]|nr:beta-ketoacyl-ACP reductase [Lachnospiraceae bacterium]